MNWFTVQNLGGSRNGTVALTKLSATRAGTYNITIADDEGSSVIC